MLAQQATGLACIREICCSKNVPWTPIFVLSHSRKISGQTFEIGYEFFPLSPSQFTMNKLRISPLGIVKTPAVDTASLNNI
jgi:hypothetical protein